MRIILKWQSNLCTLVDIMTCVSKSLYCKMFKLLRILMIDYPTVECTLFFCSLLLSKRSTAHNQHSIFNMFSKNFFSLHINVAFTTP